MKKFQNLKRNRSNVEWIIILMICVFGLVGCGGGTTPSSIPSKPKSTTIEKKKEGTQKLAEKKEVEKKDLEKVEEEEYSYNPTGKPDPFKPFIQLTATKESQKSGPLTPLQKYDISQLKLVAIITSREGNIALVEDATGKGYFLKKGTLVGKNDGKVTKILKDKVIIEEVYQDIFGQTKFNEISLSLHKLEEGGES